MTAKPLRVMIIGATGVFGARLAERAALEPGIALTLAARSIQPLEALAQRLGGQASRPALSPSVTVRVLDRAAITPADICDIDVVVDAAGPFQRSSTAVIDAAITAQVDYIDLADGRDFVAGIGLFDARARAAGVAVVSGASSVPALSHAVLDALTAGWQRIDRIRVGIFPGNRAPRGRAVVESILSYTGRPVRQFTDGRWQAVPGWGRTQRWAVPGVGRRWASVCETPDQDLLVARYHPRQSAEFCAGVELTVMHLGLLLLSLPVRWGLVRSLRPLAVVLHRMAIWLLPFGSDRGAMLVEASGIGADARPARVQWTLAATGNRGPYVPVLAALALLRRLRDGQSPPRGAYACAGILTLDDFAADFAALGIERMLTR